ncbi:MAG: hypothetical protein AB7S77_08965 [Desulfatirhabdiaceae bacterium]
MMGEPELWEMDDIIHQPFKPTMTPQNRWMALLLIFLLMVFLLSDSLAEQWPQMVVQITVDTDKADGSRWDKWNPWGIPPDVYGQITIGEKNVPVEYQANTHLLILNLWDVSLDPGQSVDVMLWDRDRFRPDDQIAVGRFVYSGESRMEKRIERAVITLELVDQHE